MILIILYTLILLFTDRTAAGAMCMHALEQWYETMIPALFPMMLISSILVDTGFAKKIGSILNFTVLRFLHISDNGAYCLITGFFFGFPMGAKTTADIYSRKGITKNEAEYLLCFINCIGPMYTINLIHPLFAEYALWKLLLGIYAVPLLYGIMLRYTLYRKDQFKIPGTDIHSPQETAPAQTALSSSSSLADALYESIPKCGKSMLMLGGYMILFQLFFITMEHFLRSINVVTNTLYPLLEITGGFHLLAPDTPLANILFYTNFTGFCCHLQSYSFLKPTDLSMSKYILHKLLLSALSLVFGLLLSCV